MNGQFKTPEKEYAQFIANQIKEFREKQGWSQDQLAEIAQLNPSVISILEKGEYLPSNILLNILAKNLNISIINPNQENILIGYF